jgi:hypothetical protein
MSHVSNTYLNELMVHDLMTNQTYFDRTIFRMNYHNLPICIVILFSL